MAGPSGARWDVVSCLTIKYISKQKTGGAATAAPPAIGQNLLLGNALAFHAFEQLRQVPDFLIGGDFASGQVF